MAYSDFEDFLMSEHSKQFCGGKDAMVDDFADWLETLSIDEWIEFGDAYKKA